MSLLFEFVVVRRASRLSSFNGLAKHLRIPLTFANMRRSSRRRPVVETTEIAVISGGSFTKSKPENRTKAKKRPRKEATSNNEDPEEETSPYFQNADKLDTSHPNEGTGERLGRDFFYQDAVTLSKALLGKVLCRKLPGTDKILKGTVVETEAYPGAGDAASHSFKGVPTPSSMAMFMDPGTAYVYFTYGMYYCFNVSAKDTGGACLFRAVEVHEDYEIMHQLRQSKKQQASDKPPRRLQQHELANGPAKLCLAFDITRNFCDKLDMTTSDELWLENSLDSKYSQRQFEVKVSRRVGIDSTPPEARNQLYRFYIDDNKSVSPAKFKEFPLDKTNKRSKNSKKQMK